MLADLSGLLVGTWQGGPSLRGELMKQGVCQGRGFPNPALTITNFPLYVGLWSLHCVAYLKLFCLIPSLCHINYFV